MVEPETAAARAFWSLGNGRGVIQNVPLAAGDAQALTVRTLFSGISRGTESLVFLGKVPPSQYQRMRCPFQDGDFPGPLKYGYISVGVVEDGPDAWRGQRVFCLFPHQDRYRVPVAALTVLPEALPARRALLAANMETAVNALWDAPPRVGDRIAVVGAGVVGLLLASLLERTAGTQVTVVDLLPERRPLALALGCRFETPQTLQDDYDLVYHTSGHPAGLTTALAAAGFETEVIELSWYGDQPVSLPLGEGFHSKRLSLRASQVGTIAPAQRARWSHARRMALVMQLLTEDARLDALVGNDSRFEDLPNTLRRLALDPGAAGCHVVRYDDTP